MLMQSDMLLIIMGRCVEVDCNLQRNIVLVCIELRSLSPLLELYVVLSHQYVLELFATLLNLMGITMQL